MRADDPGQDDHSHGGPDADIAAHEDQRHGVQERNADEEGDQDPEDPVAVE